MKGKEAKEISKNDLGVGTFSVDDPWVSSNSMVTTKTMKVGTDHLGLNRTRYYISTGDKVKVANEDTILQMEDRKVQKGDDKLTYSLLTDKDGELVCVAIPVREFLIQCIYYYRTVPSYEGQEPIKETISSLEKGSNSSEKEKEKETEGGNDENVAGSYKCKPLFLWVRLETVTEDRRRALLSRCKGVDADDLSGFAWKPLYRAAQLAQFQFGAIVLDLQGNLICKATQRGNIDPSGMYEIGPNADIVLVILSCQRLIPDGSKLTNGFEIGLDLAIDIGSFAIGF